ncbi:MAG TPA: hypothetical protein VMS96_14000 [Terriglobales bacterium]|nr:hypothetical protein [Terriglobales bacterium]
MREPAATFVTYARRLAQSVTTLHNQPPQGHSTAELARLSELHRRLNCIIDALRAGEFQLLSAAPVTFDTQSLDQFDVLERQVQVLETATVRLIDPTSASRSDSAAQAAEFGVSNTTEIDLIVPGGKAYTKSTRSFWYFGKRSAAEMAEKEVTERK